MSRRPEHWKDEAPNEPEPKTFLKEVPFSHWWVIAGLVLFTIIGLGAAWYTQREADEPSSTDQQNVAGERADRFEARLTDNGFEPGDIDVPRNQALVIQNETRQACAVEANGNEGHGVPPGEIEPAPAGGQTSWTPTDPGQYLISCGEGTDILRVTVP
jgi:hypothetical protein